MVLRYSKNVQKKCIAIWREETYVRKKKLIKKINMNSNENILYPCFSKKKLDSKFMKVRLIKRLPFTEVTVVPKK